MEIKKRYSNMYIPSDFFLSEYRWTETFPIGKPISLDFPCSFHVMHKDVDPLKEINSVLEPPDADYIYSAKVSYYIAKYCILKLYFNIIFMILVAFQKNSTLYNVLPVVFACSWVSVFRCLFFRNVNF